jgi:hypothetical protein
MNSEKLSGNCIWTLIIKMFLKIKKYIIFRLHVPYKQLILYIQKYTLETYPEGVTTNLRNI